MDELIRENKKFFSLIHDLILVKGEKLVDEIEAVVGDPCNKCGLYNCECEE